mmetsp:Transcript_11944/g.26025  ORF Transcript_11944/g.26025 Transcript_11944/m.26025 type:complete len:85 (-) Transcript_11944:133-387(-)
MASVFGACVACGFAVGGRLGHHDVKRDGWELLRTLGVVPSSHVRVTDVVFFFWLVVIMGDSMGVKKMTLYGSWWGKTVVASRPA